MNDKDKKQFTFWIDDYPSDRLDDWGLYELMKSSFQAACEYKQQEIDALENTNNIQSEIISSAGDALIKLQAENKKLRENILLLQEKTLVLGELEAENKKLREALELMKSALGISTAGEALKDDDGA
jgi:cell shape-determining protein MreC